MVDILKEAFDVNVHYKVVMGNLNVLVDQRKRVFLRAVRAKPVTVFMELRFADWFKNLQHALLYQSVKDSGDS